MPPFVVAMEEGRYTVSEDYALMMMMMMMMEPTTGTRYHCTNLCLIVDCI